MYKAIVILNAFKLYFTIQPWNLLRNVMVPLLPLTQNEEIYNNGAYLEKGTVNCWGLYEKVVKSICYHQNISIDKKQSRDTNNPSCLLSLITHLQRNRRNRWSQCVNNHWTKTFFFSFATAVFLLHKILFVIQMYILMKFSSFTVHIINTITLP